MGEYSRIEWCGSTVNFWYGCRKISPACLNCYMFREMRRYGRNPLIVTRSKTTFYDPLRWKEPHLIFVCSWSDFFIAEADPWRPEAWDIIRRTPQHTYQILTKRANRIANHLPDDWPLPNVWLGVSVENRRHGLPRIGILREIPVAVRFISAEPLLEDLRDINLQGIDWLIVGGESGPKGRWMEPDWARRLRDQSLAADVPFFFKQWGRFNQAGEPVGKKKAGRMLDGLEWNEMPLGKIDVTQKTLAPKQPVEEIGFRNVTENAKRPETR